MGQKVHPIGFRIGINKPYQATWFGQFKDYSTILQEDFNVRKLFKKEWEFLYAKIGFLRLEIVRKVGVFELVVFVGSPNAMYENLETGNFKVKMFEAKLKALLSSCQQVRVTVRQATNLETESAFIASALANQIQNRVSLKTAIKTTTQELKKSQVKGFKIQVSGRLNGAEIARREWSREGRLPLHTLKADLSYASSSAYTKHGVLGIKVWIYKR